jgi:hypothetical protein
MKKTELKRAPFKRKAKKTKKKKPAKTEAAKTKAWANKCWRLMSLYVRARDNNRCFTCGKAAHNPQAGHYAHARKTNRVSYDYRNINCQCAACNNWGNGKPEAYALKLEAIYGYGVLQEIETMKKEGDKPPIEFYEKVYEELKKRLDLLDIEY